MGEQEITDRDGPRRQSKPQCCGALGCTTTDSVEVVTNPIGESRALCPEHQEEFLRGERP